MSNSVKEFENSFFKIDICEGIVYKLIKKGSVIWQKN